MEVHAVTDLANKPKKVGGVKGGCPGWVWTVIQVVDYGREADRLRLCVERTGEDGIWRQHEMAIELGSETFFEIAAAENIF